MVGTLLYILSVVLKIGIIPVALLVYKKKIGFLSGLFSGTLLFLLSFGCTVYSADFMYGVSLIDSTVNGIFDTFIEALKTSGAYTAEEAEFVGGTIETLKETYFSLIPSVVVCTNLVFSYILLMASKGILAVCKKDVSGFLRFCDFKMSRMGIILGIAAYILFEFTKTGAAKFAFLNFAVIIMFAAFVCGFSVVDFKFRKIIKPSLPRFLIYCPLIVISAALMGFGAGLFLLIGIWDAFFDLRAERGAKVEK